MQFFCHLLWILHLTEHSTFAIQDAIGGFFAEGWASIQLVATQKQHSSEIFSLKKIHTFLKTCGTFHIFFLNLLVVYYEKQFYINTLKQFEIYCFYTFHFNIVRMSK